MGMEYSHGYAETAFIELMTSVTMQEESAFLFPQA